MLSFVYTLEFKDSRYGQNVTVSIYRIKQNLPIYLGEVKYNTGSYRGTRHEVVDFLVSNGYLPKRCKTDKRQGLGYINYKEMEKTFTLNQL